MKQLRLLLLLAIFFASCHGTWTDETKRSFYTTCTHNANAWADSPERAQEYCDCVFMKMTRKYPLEKDALAHMDSISKDPDLLECKDEILKDMLNKRLIK